MGSPVAIVCEKVVSNNATLNIQLAKRDASWIPPLPVVQRLSTQLYSEGLTTSYMGWRRCVYTLLSKQLDAPANP